MITSCAPMPFMRSNNPSPSRSSVPSTCSAGNMFGTTRTSHPGAFGDPPFWRYDRTSGGVIPSRPGQNGQCSRPTVADRSRRKSFGRFCRSVEIITHRPVTGSFRSSGTLHSRQSLERIHSGVMRTLRSVPGRPKGLHYNRVKNAGRQSPVPSPQPSAGGHVEGALKDLDRRFPRVEMDRHDVEAAGTAREVMSHHVVEREPCHPPALERSDRFGRVSERTTLPRLHLDEHQRGAIPRDDVQFATAPPVAPRNYCVPAPLQLAAREIFACFPEN